jgi:hypothetical protein
MSPEVLPPLFQILTGLTFMLLLVVRFAAGGALKPTWGKVVAFAVVFVALGHVLMSQATARSLSAGAELFAFAGASYFVGAVLVVVGLFLAVRGGAAGRS